MGAGGFGAGFGPAGSDPIVVGTSVRPRTPAAMRYEGASRDWVVNDAKDYRAVHPVDQAMALGGSVRRGAMVSAPDIGNDIHKIPYLGGFDLAAEVRDKVLNANPIKALIANGDVRIVRIDHEQMAGGGLKVAVYYKNLRLDPRRIDSIEVAT